MDSVKLQLLFMGFSLFISSCSSKNTEVLSPFASKVITKYTHDVNQIQTLDSDLYCILIDVRKIDVKNYKVFITYYRHDEQFPFSYLTSVENYKVFYNGYVIERLLQIKGKAKKQIEKNIKTVKNCDYFLLEHDPILTYELYFKENELYESKPDTIMNLQ